MSDAESIVEKDYLFVKCGTCGKKSKIWIRNKKIELHRLSCSMCTIGYFEEISAEDFYNEDEEIDELFIS